MPIESDGHSKDNPRLYELIEERAEDGEEPHGMGVAAVVDYLKIAGQPVAGPWPPHAQWRPDPDYAVRAAGRPRPPVRPAQRQLREAGSRKPEPRSPAEELMFPARFRYEAPRSVDEAIGLLRDGGDYVKVMAGGESLVR